MKRRTVIIFSVLASAMLAVLDHSSRRALPRAAAITSMESFEVAPASTMPTLRPPALRYPSSHSRISEQEEFFLTKVLPENEVRVAFSGGLLVGFVAATSDAVTQLYVRRGFQRLGVGSALLNWAKARSGGSLWLYTFARNHVARAFYEKHGFVATAHGFEPSWQLEDVKYCWVDRPTNGPGAT